MFKKVLIAEDFQDTNRGIVDALRNKLNILEIQEELYCDTAFNRLKLAQEKAIPFELLITDLFFKESHIDRRLSSGMELIKAARTLQPGLKVIVNSMEDNPVKIKTLFQEQKIDGYVCKGRHSLIELVNAIDAIHADKTYVSPQINLSTANNVFELDAFDLKILKDLADGFSKKEIVEKFKRQNISPNSESTIDKRVGKLFDEFGAKNTTHLIAKLTREGKI
ncbi:helix-turn-helix domain-containing protein [Kriegella aquimaris]|uniref:DNA-binding response regulator, NarL/FixJ family, contains REC and HTH domains n=1 Tax=Kriegella aquimaris TaxID=192904 RepID=A0A1G9RBT0_9FLAO|nr:response regulator transcription factor [Kriegella aquimaris]SDM20688.1 DNA-binding response regulator, NarL/FixJ family, contains REC and HTH domains [Kriegella aquimaris]